MPSSIYARLPLVFLATLSLTLGCTGAKQTGVSERELVGHVWLVEDIDGRGVIDFLQSTVDFENDTRVGGMAGCNRFFGSIELDGENITVGPLAGTRKFCTQAVMDQEQRLLSALERVTRYEFKETILFMYADDTPVLRLTRLDAS
jgi:heat shock protein HslJ